ncbi:hypothetical protein BD310DRAFT_917137 [Dichomitus squalens]|uniref:Uncharacterized protein n=1 Tax=Dichomitus squalens TaxID=114155 RepID=A0A4Q9Q6Y8_9APHY|nr:hypothetical protein BD310DRAFT_917137 [Dichomitus squalens]
MDANDQPADVESLPTEIWQHIIAEACEDGGRTGTSLILTSKFFHTHAFYNRFDSLALTSLARLEGFLSCVRSSVWPFPVRHLWLSPQREWKAASSYQAVAEQKKLWDARFVNAIRELLPLVTPTTRTLVIVPDGSWLGRVPWFECNFPLLEELTVCGDVAAVLPSSADSAHETGPDSATVPGSTRDLPHVPSLKRFHIATNSSRARVALLSTSSWLRASPITHLRVSGVSDEDPKIGFTRILARALGVPEPSIDSGWNADGESHPALPAIPGPLMRGETILPCLQKLMIQTVEPNPGLRGDVDDPFDQLKASLRELAWEIEDVEGLSLLVMEKSWKKLPNREQRLWDHWLDRMEGRKGCWVESAEEEEALEGPDDPHPHVVTGFLVMD